MRSLIGLKNLQGHIPGRAFSNNLDGKKVLVVGAKGQIGKCVTNRLISELGADRVVASDISQADIKFDCKQEHLDVTDYKQYEQVVKENNINYIFHSSALVSAVGEQFPDKAINVNINGFMHCMDIAKENKCGVFFPSTVLVFGGDKTPKVNTPTDTILNPPLIYGVSKVFSEQLGTYYYNKFGVDFRSLRYPVVVSSEKYDFLGTAVYSTQIFFEALEKQYYKCYLRPDTLLPMMSIEDTVKFSLQLMKADNSRLSSRYYNGGGISLTPEDFASAIKKMIPEFKMDYEIEERRQTMADSMPQSMDVSQCEKDWDYSYKETKQEFCEKIMKGISDEYKKGVNITYSS